MRRPIQTLMTAVLAFSVSAIAAGAFAADDGQMVVRLNESRRVMLHGAASSVVVGDPTIADVAMSDSHSVIIMGKGYGTTQIVVVDQGGRTLLADAVTVVEPDNGRVTFFHEGKDGAVASNFACDGERCHPIADVKMGAGGSGGGAGQSGEQDNLLQTQTGQYVNDIKTAAPPQTMVDGVPHSHP